MKKKIDYLTRANLLKLLSDDEVASVSSAETAARLAQGEEFLDLDALGEGVQTAKLTTMTSPGRVLPKKAIHAKTWSKILKQLNARPEEAARSGV